MSEPVAIVGMACLFAGAPDLQRFRDNVLGGVDALSDAPRGWLPDGPSATRNPSVYTTRGGWLGDLASFDPLAYGVMPSSVDGSEPEHFVALRLAAEALADAGYAERPFPRETTGVILGRGTYVNRAYVSVIQHTIGVDQTVDLLGRLHPEWPDDELDRIGAALRQALPPFTAETAPGLAHSVMCGRIANRLDLMGPAYSVDAACASSLIALELAMAELEAGHADLVLAGGIQVSTSFPIAALFCRLGALSRSGSLRPFDPHADGTLLGEGAGIVAVKRLADAERDGDRVYAVLRGVGSASDGQAMGILAPRVEGEELAMRRAYQRAGVTPASIGLLEAHGTGTVVGDGTEVEAIGRVWAGHEPRAGVAIGSVKSMIGHCIPAAGIAGVIKTALALHHRVLPPTLHADAARPRFAGTPFHLTARTRAWVQETDRPRRAAVSAFGFGGIDAHAILEEHPATPPPERTRCGDPTELFVLTGRDRAALRAAVAELRSAVRDGAAPDLAGLARRFPARCPDPGELRAAVVADSAADLLVKLDRLDERLADAGCERITERRGIYFTAAPLLTSGALAYVFPGEGAQHPGMLADLCRELPAARRWFDLLDAALPDARVAPSRLVFGEDPDPAPLLELGLAVLSVYAADRAALATLDLLGARPAMVAGHSSGEYAALAAAGATPDGSTAELVGHLRAAAELTARAVADGVVPLAGLLAVGAAPSERVEQVLAAVGEVSLALDNCPHQTILCGPVPQLEEAARRLAAAGAICQRLPFGRAYHTPAFRPMAERLAGFYATLDFRTPEVSLYSCVTAAPVPADPDEVRRLALEQWSSPVRFRETVEAMYDAGARVFVEVGPGDMLTGMVRDILGRREHLVVGLESRGRGGIAQLHHVAAQLLSHGAELRLDLLTRAKPVPTRSQRERPLDVRLPVLALDADTHRARSEPRHDDPAPGGAGPAAAPSFPATMRHFLDVERSVVTAALRALPARTSGADLATTGPELLAGARVVRRDADVLELDLTLVADEVDYLDDHRLGPVVSVRPDVRALAVLPLAVALELLVQTAAQAGGAAGPVRLSEVRAGRWVSFPTGRGTLRLAAVRRADAAWAVSLRQGGAVGPGVTAVVELGTAPDPAASLGAPEGSGAGGRRSRWSGPELYREGAWHGMFHGPTLRTVAEVDAVRDRAAAARLEPSPDSTLAAATLTSPLLVDAAGQVLGYWTAESLRERFVVFPTSIDSLTVLDPGAAGPARSRVWVRELTDDHVRADLDVDGAGVRVRARGWTARRLTLSEEYYRFRLDPRGEHLSQPLRLPPIAHPLGTARVDLSPGLLEAEGGLWGEVLAHLALGPAEREEWARQDRRRTRRLLGRIAAKDAVRRLLADTLGDQPYPADVEVGHDERGRPLVTGPGLGGPPGVLVSVSYAGDTAVAVSAPAGRVAGLGLDVEWLRDVAGLEESALTDEERALLDAVPLEGRAALALALWCAKEATTKALGTGFAALGGPQRLVARPVPGRPGRLRVEVVPEGSGGGRRELEADTWLADGLVHGLVLLPSPASGAEPAEHGVDQHHVVGQADQVGDQLAHPLG